MRPVTTRVADEPDADRARPPSSDVHTTRYDVIGNCSSADGAVTTAVARPAAVRVIVGAAGFAGTLATSTIELDAVAGPVPTLFVAATVQLTRTNGLGKPVTSIGLDAPVAVRTVSPSSDVHRTRYAEIGAPPVVAGAPNSTRTLPAKVGSTADGDDSSGRPGWPGKPTATNAALAADALLPIAVTAEATQV